MQPRMAAPPTAAPACRPSTRRRPPRSRRCRAARSRRYWLATMSRIVKRGKRMPGWRVAVRGRGRQAVADRVGGDDEPALARIERLAGADQEIEPMVVCAPTARRRRGRRCADSALERAVRHVATAGSRAIASPLSSGEVAERRDAMRRVDPARPAADGDAASACSRSSNIDDACGCPRRAHRVEALVDVVERDAAGDQLVELEPAVEVGLRAATGNRAAAGRRRSWSARCASRPSASPSGSATSSLTLILPRQTTWPPGRDASNARRNADSRPALRTRSRRRARRSAP